MINKTKIAIIGLGYVGLLLALEFSKFFEVVAYDNNKKNGDWIENHDRSIEDVAAAILSLQGKLSLVELIY